MAASKLSALTQVNSANNDDLLLLSVTEDGGTTYSSNNITVADLLSGLSGGDGHTTESTQLTDSADLVRGGDLLTRMVAPTAADSEPTSWLFLVVDTTDGSIKAIDKTFLEIE